MRIVKVGKTYRSVKRLKQIISVLLKYGFVDVAERLKRGTVSRRLFRSSKVVEQYEHLSTPQRIRLALTELGPTFIKLGQVLSTRPDLIPLPVVRELEKLQDQVPPFPSATAMKIATAELGRPLTAVFASFVEEPLAAASIAQVHRATMADGQPVILKIQRPEIRAMIETDISLLYYLAGIFEKFFFEGELYNPRAIVDEFAKTIRDELDFVREGRNIDRFRHYFADDPTIYIPRVYWNATTSQLLTMEYIDGVKISEIDFSQRPDLDRKLIARYGAQATLKMIFELGFFHADPHPGNIFVLKNNVIAPLDFGMVGRLDEQTRNYLRNLLLAIVERDIEKIIRIFIEAEVLDESNNSRSLRLDLHDFIDNYYGLPLSQIKIEKLLGDLIDILRRHHIALLTDVVLMAKALATIEGVGRKLDPEFNMMVLVEPYARQLISQPFAPRRRLHELREMAQDTESLLKILPAELKYLLKKVKKGKMNLIFEHRGLDRLILELDRSSNRLSFSLIIAALIIGSSIVVVSGQGPFIFGLSIVGILGYLTAAVLGLWLVIAILRSGKL
ncbi:MAG: AarF/UbiB family protein [candidate division KSB1 bacterium]|nr:AarF/UbiB family protein [candidate division KSB1 bacterium]MDZ7319686.1 AarF/UbiB family protein [candidate division KSB1 bacterium]MDZ7342324.1 AarF/UbiB family protein [candidate division KSB1 bacterium]